MTLWRKTCSIGCNYIIFSIWANTIFLWHLKRICCYMAIAASSVTIKHAALVHTHRTGNCTSLLIITLLTLRSKWKTFWEFYFCHCNFHCSEVKRPHTGSIAPLPLHWDPMALSLTEQKVVLGTVQYAQWQGEVEEDRGAKSRALLSALRYKTQQLRVSQPAALRPKGQARIPN